MLMRVGGWGCGCLLRAWPQHNAKAPHPYASTTWTLLSSSRCCRPSTTACATSSLIAYDVCKYLATSRRRNHRTQHRFATLITLCGAQARTLSPAVGFPTLVSPTGHLSSAAPDAAASPQLLSTFGKDDARQLAPLVRLRLAPAQTTARWIMSRHPLGTSVLSRFDQGRLPAAATAAPSPLQHLNAPHYLAFSQSAPPLPSRSIGPFPHLDDCLSPNVPIPNRQLLLPNRAATHQHAPTQCLTGVCLHLYLQVDAGKYPGSAAQAQLSKPSSSPPPLWIF